MRAHLLRKPRHAGLCVSGQGADSAGLSGVDFLAGVGPDIQGVAQHGLKVAQKKPKIGRPWGPPWLPQRQDTLELDEL